MSSHYGQRSARSSVKMYVNIVKSSACHIQRFAREARAIEKVRSWTVMSAREKLCHGKVHWVLGKEDGILWIKGPLEQKCPQVIGRDPFVIEIRFICEVEKGPHAKSK